ncbi:MAG: autotransporter-associated beta strand repeat-containing protein, partial [Verrucomicrobiota bacterium]
NNIATGGASNVTFTTTNTYSGTTKISGGSTLVLGSATALGSSTLDYTNSYGGTLSFGTQTAVTLGGLMGDQNLALTNASAAAVALTVGGNQLDTTYSGSLSGSGSSVTKTGVGALTLTGTNSYTGGTTVTTGTLKGNSASLQGNVTNNSALVFDQGTAGTYAGALSGTGTLAKTGSGALTVNGTNTNTGTTTITNGTLQFAKVASLYNSTTASWTAVNISVASGGTLAVNVGGTGEFTTGNVTTLLTNLGGLGAAVTYNGLQAGSKIAFDTTNASGGNFTVANAIANSTGSNGGGAIGVTKLGPGSLTLSAASSYTGETTVAAGKLVVNGNISTSALTTVNSGASLGGNGTMGAAVISGSLAPGNSIGTITATSNVTWNAGDAWVFELGSAASSLALANSGSSIQDLLNITGAGNTLLKGTGSVFTFDFAGTGATGWYKLVDYTGTSTFTHTDFAATGLTTGLTGDFTVDSATSAIYVNVVPEPGTALLGGLGALALLRRRRSGRNVAGRKSPPEGGTTYIPEPRRFQRR